MMHLIDIDLGQDHWEIRPISRCQAKMVLESMV